MERSYLARIPPELRDLIYELTFRSEYAVTLGTNNIQHPLTRTCRAIRSETLSMYLQMTRFNAHLDDGPAWPLARWLQTIGPAHCLGLRTVGIWDMHMLNGSIHGARAAQKMLQSGTEEGEDYVLKPIGRDMFHGSWYLKDIVLALQGIGLGLLRFCVAQSDGHVKQTSRFAIQSMQFDDECGLAGQFGLSSVDRERLVEQLDEGRRLIRFHEGRRNIFLGYDMSRRLVTMRQQFVPRDEEFYM